MSAMGSVRSHAASLMILVAVFAAGCTGSATVAETGTAARATPVERATTDAVEPTAPPAEPSAVAADPTNPVPEPTEITVEPTPAGISLPLESFRSDNVVAIANGGRYGYAGTSSAWIAPTACDAILSESLAHIDIERAAAGEVEPLAAGLEQAGDVRQMVVGPDASVVIVSSCGEPDASEIWMQRAEIGDDGRLVNLGAVVALGADGESDPYLLSWSGPDTVELRVIIEEDPEDFESWIVERRQVSVSTGDVISFEQFSYFDDDDFGTRPLLTTADGFSYRTIEDPGGALGCEGFGVARTLEVDDGETFRLALTQPGLVFSDVSNLHASDSGHIAWTSGCEGFITAYVGKLLPNGLIADAHFIDLYTQPFEAYADYGTFRLTNDGFLVGIGQSFDPDIEAGTLAFLRYDLNTDPNFVNTAEPAPIIDPDPLLVSLAGDGSWHVGESLATLTSCGASTLYGQTPGGFVRAFSAGVELDPIVAMDAAETRVTEFDEGRTYSSRTVVVQTECPANYQGRRVWFGTENEQLVWGLSLVQADLGEVANVLSVRDVYEADTGFFEATIIEVELLDGNVAEVELTALPFDG